ncbi:protein-L-isoaspartate O-methyltransferase [Aestuariivita sp.]|jgi:protein-L-isoaspartate(D-aspartate) O-methyltransferase|uniref:protein-L-isoaspartate O-methyltransferase family protein n=1 Tax=Aestuariivita sp. TaxID=1872407 RepID=UPI0021720344|nr:protein-L-isoaspartate O-methyltransferase [Aestuariivita sp.]MCE8005934.1 protein-L-isoaspartate O-methyltransferase [Aestuariivita sp.]
MPDYTTRRRMMVDTQVRPSDVTKFPIIDAMLTVPREMFVPASAREVAYAGEHVRLAPGRVLLDPRLLAKMLDALDLDGSELVLDIGGGLGYSSAVVARMTQAVVMLEEDPELAREAQSLLSEAGADNVIVQEGALADGADEHGPYDAILLEGGVGDLPRTIEAQLKDGGRIACLFMEGRMGKVKVGHKINGEISWRYVFDAGAPILPGFEKQTAFTF